MAHGAQSSYRSRRNARSIDDKPNNKSSHRKPQADKRFHARAVHVSARLLPNRNEEEDDARNRTKFPDYFESHTVGTRRNEPRNNPRDEQVSEGPADVPRPNAQLSEISAGILIFKLALRERTEKLVARVRRTTDLLVAIRRASVRLHDVHPAKSALRQIRNQPREEPSMDATSTSHLEHLRTVDPKVFSLIRSEQDRQRSTIRLIPSENYASRAVMEATGTVLTNKYSEGYPGKRYYQGQEFIDQIEALAQKRAKELFGVEHANVQPYSGSPANAAVYLALVEPGDTVMGLSLPFGGHLTHGWRVNFSGIQYRAIQYEVDPETHTIDLNQVAELAKKERPKLIFTGGTAYPRLWDFEGFERIAADVGAVLVADIAHISGLVAAGVHPSPVPHAPIVTSTTHKTLRGPRGGMILSTEEYARPLDRAVFPGLQGGPHNHTTAALAVALAEANTDAFRQYAAQIVTNAKALAAGLLEFGFRLISGGTDNHLILIDTTAGTADRPGIPGKQAAQVLEAAGLECNYNTVPFDPRKPFDPSGIRLGTPGVTSCGMREPEMARIAQWMQRALASAENPDHLASIRAEVAEACSAFPPPGLN